MKFWERLSRSTFKLAALPFLNRIRSNSIESILKNSILLLNPETTDEIKTFIQQKQAADGGFKDRAGKSDLYYSLFGHFIAEAFSVPNVSHRLKEFVKKQVASDNLSGVHLYCGAILYSKLFKADEISDNLREKVLRELSSTLQPIDSSQHLHIRKSAYHQISTSPNQHIEYAAFMGFLALYYLEDYLSLNRLLKKYRSIQTTTGSATPVLAASCILLELAGRKDSLSEEKIKSCYRQNGGFLAVKNAPCEDLLSTGIALYALKFIDSDVRILKPQCLAFVDDLYDNGGFRATQSDFETDTEYTFYGLLALGSLK